MTRTAKDIGDELYALAPQAFTAARDTHAAQARTDGDRGLAAEIAGLKKPSMSAWLVNLVALQRPEAVQQLIELGETIRQAQGSVAPAQLRDLSTRRRKELDAILALAQSLAADSGQAKPGKAHLTEVEATFAAAMADEDSARLVKAGRVLKGLSYSGFGQAPGGFPPPSPAVSSASPAASAVGAGAASSATATDSEATAASEAAIDPGPASAAAAAADMEAQAEARRAEARGRVDEARSALAAAAEVESERERHVKGLTGEIAALRDRLDAAQREARAARQARIAAERDVASAQRRLARTT